MKKQYLLFVAISIALSVSALSRASGPRVVDVLFKGAQLYDGGGNPWVAADVGVAGGRISFIGHADVAGVTGKEVVDAHGLVLTPGFIDMHSHADLDDPEGRRMLPSLYQGITTIVEGIDGDGTDAISKDFARYRKNGIGVNVLRYVGFNAARYAVMGMSDAAPTPAQLQGMKDYVERGMKAGAFGMSSGLFYVPAAYATTAEVIEVAKVSGRYHGIYDTHDRDLGAVYKGVGYLASTAEAIEIGEKSGNSIIFSHFSPQSVSNYGRAAEGAKLIEDARARGVNVMAAQHAYTASNSNLLAYALPTWAVAGGDEAKLARFQDPETRKRMQAEHEEMLKIRGGAEKLVFTDTDPELNGKSLAQVAREWGVSAFDATVRIASKRDLVEVENVGLYDQNNIDYLAQKEWMMTCTDGYPGHFGQGIVHPRAYGSFSLKLRSLVLDRHLITLPFAIRGMTGLAAEFLALPDRGLIKEGFRADLLLIDLKSLRDKATYEKPHAYSEGMVDVMVNGRFEIRDHKPTEVLAGQPIERTRQD